MVSRRRRSADALALFLLAPLCSRVLRRPLPAAHPPLRGSAERQTARAVESAAGREHRSAAASMTPLADLWRHVAQRPQQPGPGGLVSSRLACGFPWRHGAAALAMPCRAQPSVVRG